MKKEGEKSNQEEINKMLVENFVSLQRVLTDLSIKFDKLANNMSGLLSLFELSARSFMNKPEIKDSEKDKEFLDKLNALLEQNKTIAKGLTLMEEKIRERVYGQNTPQERALPLMPPQERMQQQPQFPPQSPIKKLPRF